MKNFAHIGGSTSDTTFGHRLELKGHGGNRGPIPGITWLHGLALLRFADAPDLAASWLESLNISPIKCLV